MNPKPPYPERDTFSDPIGLEELKQKAKESSSIRAEVLDTAKSYVLKDRNADYDTPERNFETISNLWNIYMSESRMEDGSFLFQPHDVAVFMILVKVARIVSSPQKIDHWIDIAGYAACGAECIKETEE